VIPSPFTRLPSPVEAMRLSTVADVHDAERWLRSHGVQSAIRLGYRDGALQITGPNGATIPASLGQWLVFDLTLRDFTVLDDEHFRVGHCEHWGVAS
jgi:hypothetical protein